MAMRRFQIHVRGTVELDLDDRVIAAVNDDWRKHFYDLHTPGDIAEMVARCAVLHHAPLSMLDGFADQPDDFAKVVSQDIGFEAERVS